MTEMYELIDVMLDGATTELLTGLLSTAVTFGLVSMGFLMGALTGIEPPRNIVC
jgi:hypothetical protein